MFQFLFLKRIPPINPKKLLMYKEFFLIRILSPGKQFNQRKHLKLTEKSHQRRVAFAIEKNNIDAWKSGCKAGTENCTSLTLTKIEDASMPGFKLPKFSYTYEFMTENGTLADHQVSFRHVMIYVLIEKD